MATPQAITINHRNFDAGVLRVLELHADYVCGNSGQCCHEDWGITLQGPDKERFVAALVKDGMTREAAEACFRPSPTELYPDGVRMACETSGECPFCGIREDGASLCTIHATHGSQVIPSVCQSFPRLAVGTPAGVYLTLSYTCPTAARLLLNADGLRETSARKIFQSQPELLGTTFGETKEAPRFSAECRPSWANFDYFWRWTPEWMANPALTPAQALYGLGRVVGFVESFGAKMADQATLIELLDEAGRVLPAVVKAECEKVGPVTELGAIYMDTLMNLMQKAHYVPEALVEWWEGMSTGDKRLDRAQLIAAYDQTIRPRLGEFELIERNFIASRLFANPLAYRGKSLRTGYFIVVLSLIALRFAALAICRREGVALDAEVWLRAASLTDRLLLHHANISQKFLELLEQNIQTDINDLVLPAIF